MHRKKKFLNIVLSIFLFIITVFSSSIAFSEELPEILIHEQIGFNVGSSVSLSSDNKAYIASRDGLIYRIEPQVKSYFQTSQPVVSVIADLGVQIASTPVLNNDDTHLYVTALDGRLYNFNLITNKLSWVFPATPFDDSLSRSSPAMDLDGNIYFGDSKGRFYSIKPNGEELYPYTQIQDLSEIGASPTVGTDGKVYFGNKLGYYYAFNPIDGTITQLLEAYNYPLSSTSISPYGDLLFGKGKTKTVKLFSDNGLEYLPENFDSSTFVHEFNNNIGNKEPGIADNALIFVTYDKLKIRVKIPGSSEATFYTYSLPDKFLSSSPAIVKEPNGDLIIYLSTSSNRFEENGVVTALRFDGQSIVPVWTYEFSGEQALGHFFSAPTVDNEGNVHVVSSFGEYFKFKGIEGELLPWSMFGANNKHQRVLADEDRDGCPDGLDKFSKNASECLDNDLDGIGDNQDLDDDNDGLPDEWEISAILPGWVSNSLDGLPQYTVNFSQDLDNDGFSNYLEFVLGGDPWVSDTQDADQDGYLDIWENHYIAPLNVVGFSSTVNNSLDIPSNLGLKPSDDFDGDGLSNFIEHNLKSNPYSRDTDNDGIEDAVEHATGTNYSYGNLLCLDNNKDGLTDNYFSDLSMNLMFSDSNLDFDCDGYSNLYEVTNGENFQVNEFDTRLVLNQEASIANIHNSDIDNLNPAMSGFKSGSTKVHITPDGKYVTIFNALNASYNGNRQYVFSRDLITGELSFIKSSIVLIPPYKNWVSHPSKPFIYTADTSYSGLVIKKFYFNENTFLWTTATSPFPQIPLVKDDDLPLNNRSLVTSYNTAYSESKVQPAFSKDGNSLFIPTSGQTGLLVFNVNPEDGMLTFNSHVLEEANELFPAFVSASSEGDFVYVASGMSATIKQLKLYKRSGSGTLGDLLENEGIPVSTFNQWIETKSLMPGMGSSVISFNASGVNSYSYDSGLNLIQEQLLEPRVIDQVNYQIPKSYSGINQDRNLLVLGKYSYIFNNDSYSLLAVNKASILSSDNLGLRQLEDWIGSTLLTPNAEQIYFVDNRNNRDAGLVGFPVDFPGKGRPDSDGDLVEDLYDAFPDDPRFSEDHDGDGYRDSFTESCDQACQENSGFTTYELDPDDDNDGYPDEDLDGDEFDDKDYFPLNPYAWKDTDKDGKPDFFVNCDLACQSTLSLELDYDSDNDGYRDYQINGNPDSGLFDAFPINKSEWFDTDNDRVGNNSDEDDDGDGIPDSWEVLYSLNPFDPSDASLDIDVSVVDGVVTLSPDGFTNLQEFLSGSNPYDPDSDNDGIIDSVDAFTLDDTEFEDLDGDGIGNNADLDQDDDRLVDSWEIKYAALNDIPMFDPLINNQTGNPQTHYLSDPDGDGVRNEIESIFGTNPFDYDTDGDNLPDSFEIQYALNNTLDQVQEECEYNNGIPLRFNALKGLDPLIADADNDPDCDSYSNLQEFEMGFNPLINEFDNRTVYDEQTDGRRVARLINSDLDIDDNQKLEYTSSSQIIMMPSGKYIIILSNNNRYLFKRDISTGELSFVSVFGGGISLNYVVHPNKPWVYFYNHNSSYARFSILKLDEELESISQTYASDNIMGIYDNAYYSNLDEALSRLSEGGEVVDTRATPSYIAPKISTDGKLLYLPSKGITGVLVYSINPESGFLTFLSHLPDAEEEIDSALIETSVDSTKVFITSANPGSTRHLKVFEVNEDGVLGDGVSLNVPITISESFVLNKWIKKGLKDNEILAETKDGFLSFIFNNDTNILSEPVYIEFKEAKYFTGISSSNSLLQLGVNSFFLSDLQDSDQKEYSFFSKMVTREASGIGWFGIIYSPLNIWEGSSVMSPDGSYLYFLDNRTPDEHGLVGFPVDYQGIGRPDSDGDGVENIFDAFWSDPTEQFDTDNDGIGNNADTDDDGDGLSDTWEFYYCVKLASDSNQCDPNSAKFNPLRKDISIDTDADGLLDIEEQALGTNPFLKDTDNDLIWDSWEFVLGLNPLIADSHLDPDQDGYSNLKEFQLGTPLFFNTFENQALTELDTLEEDTLTESGLSAPISRTAKKIILHPTKQFLYVLDIDEIHIFSINSVTGKLSFWDSVPIAAHNSSASGISIDGSTFHLFIEGNENGNYRYEFDIDPDTGLLSQRSKISLELRAPFILPNQNDERADNYGEVSSILFAPNEVDVYVPSKSLGFIYYNINEQTKSLEYRGYFSDILDTTKGSVISRDISGQSLYVINGSNIEIFSRNQDTGDLTHRETITNEINEPYLDIISGIDKNDWIVSSATEINIKQEKNDLTQTTVNTIESSGLLEINNVTTNILYNFTNGLIEARDISENSLANIVYDSTNLSIDSVSVLPIDTAIDTKSNYLFVLTKSENDAKQLFVYLGAVKGRGHVDSDGDGVYDINDALPYNPNETVDVDGDGCGDAYHDKFINSNDECLDSDGDGLSDELTDNDDDNDGFDDVYESLYTSDKPGCSSSLLDPKVFNSPSENYDDDSYDLADEYRYKTNPCSSDSDQDGILDHLDTKPNIFSALPSISILGDSSITIESGSNFEDPGATASDIRYGNISNDIEVNYSSVNFNEVGEYTITYSITVDDEYTNTATRTIIIEDTTAPEILFDGPEVINVESGPNYSTWPEFLNFMRCQSTIHFKNCSENSLSAYIANKKSSDNELEIFMGDGETMSQGEYLNFSLSFIDSTNCETSKPYQCFYITYVATDKSNNSSSLTREIRVYPAQAPNFSLSYVNLEGVTEVELNSEFKYKNSFSALDNVDGNLFRNVEVVGSVNSELNGTYYQYYYEKGTNQLGISDRAGNRSPGMLTRTVVVADRNIPNLTLCGPTTVILEQNSEYFEPRLPNYLEDFLDDDMSKCEDGNVAFYADDLTDGYLDLCEENQINGCVSVLGLKELDTAVPGLYPITYQAIDTAGQRSETVVRNIIIQPAEGPILTLIGPQNYIWNQGVRYIDPGADVVDNVDQNLTVDIDSSAVNVHLAGHYPVYLSATDNSGNISETLTRVVQVLDIVPPTITLLGSNPVYLKFGEQYIDRSATVSDLVGVQSFERFGIESINSDISGLYIVEYKAKDFSGNESIAIRRVIVGPEDITPPILELEDSRVENVNGKLIIEHQQGTVFDQINFKSVDDFSGDLSGNVELSGSVNLDLAGEYEVSYKVKDDAGNSSQEIRITIKVIDRTAPIVTLNGASKVILNKTSESIFYNDPFVVATDNLDGVLTEENITVAIFHLINGLKTPVDKIDKSAQGEYLIEYSVTDSSNNLTVVQRRVFVLDMDKPIISLNGDNPLYLEQSTQFIDPGASVVDAVDKNISADLISISGVVDIDKAGEYVLRYDFVDSDGFAADQLVRQVIVADTLEPLLTLIGDSTMRLECGVEATDPGANAHDFVDGDITNTIKITSNLLLQDNLINTSAKVNSSINYEVADSAGNEAVPVERLVNVVDSLAPQITIPFSLPYTHEQGTAFNAPDLTIAELCDPTKVNVQISGSVNENEAGTYSLFYKATDSSLLDSDIVEVQVQVSDTTPPTLSLVGSSTINHEQGSLYTDQGASAFDSVDGDLSSIIQVSGSVNSNIAGTYTLTYSVSDSSGNAAIQSIRTVVVSDTTAPVITLVGSDTHQHEQSTVFIDPGFSAYDSVDGDLTSSVIVTGSVDSNTSGTYILSYDVSDSSSNFTQTITRTVIVSDTTAPVIVLTGLANIEHEQGVLYSDPGATASDTVDGDLSSEIIVGGLVDYNVIGSYLLTYDVTDAAGNIAKSVGRTINVSDTTIPVITLLGSASVNHEQGTPYVDAGATASDTVDGDLSSAIIVTGSVNTAVAGTYTLSYAVSDTAGNAATVLNRTIIVADTTAPEISLMGSSTVNHEQGTPYVDAGATASDSVDGNLTSVITVTGSVNTAVAGTYTLSYAVSDTAGNAATVLNRTIIVADTTAPEISLMGSSTVNHEQGTPYVDAGATASDSVDGNLTSVITVTGSVNTAVAGTYTLNYDVSDAVGNTAATITRTVTVQDTTAPVIRLIGTSTVNHEQGTPYVDAGATANDTVDGDLSSTIIVTGSVNASAMGTYTLSYEVSDAAGNAAIMLTRTIIVADTTAPVISLTGSSTVNHEQGTPYVDAGATASDSVDGNLTSVITVTGSVNTAVAGTYTLNYDVSDAVGNTAATITRTVTVQDTTAPVIRLIGTSTVNHEQGTPYVDAGATANDTVDGDLSSTIIVTGSVNASAMGTYTLSYEVSDAAGNAAIMLTRTIIVADTTAPVISLTGSSTVNHEQGIPYVDAGATASDTVDGDLSSAIIVTGSVNTAVAGTYTLSYAVSDTAGNAATVLNRTIIVADTTAPVITLLGSSTVNHEQGIPYVDAGATASDTLDGDITNNIIVNGSVDVSKPGQYNLIYHVSDIAGNPAQQIIRTVNVSDTTKPVIVLNGSSNLVHEQGTSYTDLGANASDNIDGNLTSAIQLSGSVNVNVAGTYILNYSVTDSAGNQSEQVIRTVVVKDTTPPLLSLVGGNDIQHEQSAIYIDLGATAIDGIDGDITSNITISGSVNENVAGDYVLTYSVIDQAGNSASLTRLITVADTTIPVISIDNSVILPLQVIQNSNLEIPEATALDNIGGDLTAQIQISHNVNTAVIGDYVINYNVQDASGNEAIEITIPVEVIEQPQVVEYSFKLNFSDITGGGWVGNNQFGIIAKSSSYYYDFNQLGRGFLQFSDNPASWRIFSSIDFGSCAIGYGCFSYKNNKNGYYFDGTQKQLNNYEVGGVSNVHISDTGDVTVVNDNGAFGGFYTGKRYNAHGVSMQRAQNVSENTAREFSVVKNNIFYTINRDGLFAAYDLSNNEMLYEARLKPLVNEWYSSYQAPKALSISADGNTLTFINTKYMVVIDLTNGEYNRFTLPYTNLLNGRFINEIFYGLLADGRIIKINETGEYATFDVIQNSIIIDAPNSNGFIDYNPLSGKLLVIFGDNKKGLILDEELAFSNVEANLDLESNGSVNLDPVTQSIYTATPGYMPPSATSHSLPSMTYGGAMSEFMQY